MFVLILGNCLFELIEKAIHVKNTFSTDSEENVNEQYENNTIVDSDEEQRNITSSSTSPIQRRRQKSTTEIKI